MLNVLRLLLSEQVRTDCRLQRTFVRETSNIELLANQCNFGSGTCQKACFSSQMVSRHHFMIPEATSPSGTFAKSVTSNMPILASLFDFEDFCAYGLAFQQRFAPNLDNKRVTSLDRTRTGFHASFER